MLHFPTPTGPLFGSLGHISLPLSIVSQSVNNPSLSSALAMQGSGLLHSVLPWVWAKDTANDRGGRLSPQTEAGDGPGEVTGDGAHFGLRARTGFQEEVTLEWALQERLRRCFTGMGPLKASGSARKGMCWERLVTPFGKTPGIWRGILEEGAGRDVRFRLPRAWGAGQRSRDLTLRMVGCQGRRLGDWSPGRQVIPGGWHLLHFAPSPMPSTGRVT